MQDNYAGRAAALFCQECLKNVFLPVLKASQCIWYIKKHVEILQRLLYDLSNY